MWDNSTGRGKGYGFVTFSDKIDAEDAIVMMHGAKICGRFIRVNWATHKNEPVSCNCSSNATLTLASSSSTVSASLPSLSRQNGPTYDFVLYQAPESVTTVYVGNLSTADGGVSQQQLASIFSQYGIVTEVRAQPERGFAFIK